MINNFSISLERKVQIASRLEFMSSKDIKGKRKIFIASSSLENMLGEDTDKIIAEPFFRIYVLHIYEDALKAITSSKFLSYFAERMFYKFHTTRLD